ncbi:alpha/beta hydrolase [Caulobacter soli]|uniref:alpha/beta hydrolase n=1 Tax=Caulobacter soli TaxID=2708539 RepID=UPI001FE70F67|nr:alpha/beta hydrolase [Caulobacter soli]
MTRRAGLIALTGSALSACSPLSLFATFTPKDAARSPEHGVAFGSDPRQKLDVYAPPKASSREAAPAPVAVFFYGGSWDSGRRQDYGWVGRALAAQGFLTIVPDYRLYPAVRYPSFLEDGALAVRWAVDHARRLGGDPGRIVLIGHSAGAYNAAMLALDERYLKAAGVDPKVVRAFAGLSGPYDFLPLDGPITRRTFGEAPDLPATQPGLYARPDSPPAFLGTGDGDTTVKPRNTRALAAALRAKGAAVEERHYAGLNHADTVLALSRPFRGKAPVLAEMTAFLKARVGEAT